jgi:hypothetical protein
VPNSTLERVQFCTDSGSIVLEGFKGTQAHGVAIDDCEFAKPDKRVFELAKMITRITKLHFPDFPTHYFLGH